MPPARDRRSLALFITVVAASILTGLVVSGVLTQPASDGPAALSDPVRVEYELAIGDTTTWGTTMPAVSGSAPATLIRVELIGLRGLNVLGIAVCPHVVTGCAIINAKGWPPAGIVPTPVDGAEFGGHGAPVQLLVGLSRSAEDEMGQIDGVRLTYTADGKTFQVDEPWALALYAPGALPASN